MCIKFKHPQNNKQFRICQNDRLDKSLMLVALKQNTCNTVSPTEHSSSKEWELAQVTILPKIRGNSQESFTVKSCENVDSFSQEFLVTHSEEFLVTNSEEILVTLSKEFLVTNSREFLSTNSSDKPEKICSKKVFRTDSWEFPWNYSQDFLKSSSGISWNIH